MKPADAGGVVLVIGCGMRPYREYLLASAAARHPLWLFDEAPLTWQRRHVRGGTVVELASRDAVVAAARDLAATTAVAGVLSWDETLIVATAHVADALGLPGAGVDGIEGCRDKARCRSLLTAAGVAQPRFAYAADEDAAAAAAAGLGYPVVVKPRAGGASIGVVLAEDEAGLRRGFHTAHQASLRGAPAYAGGALVEEYLDGPEISVDSAVVAGECLPLFVARKSVGMHPYFEELGHIVDPGDELLRDPALTAMLTAAHRAIGFGSGVTHTELKLTGGGPVIVEINGRLGGDLIPLLARFASGVEPGAVAVEVAMGARPAPPPVAEGRCAGVRFAYPPRDCQVESVAVPVPRPDAGLLAASALAAPGDLLALPPAGFLSRHAYVICGGVSPASCAAALTAALAEVRLTTTAPAMTAARGG